MCWFVPAIFRHGSLNVNVCTALYAFKSLFWLHDFRFGVWITVASFHIYDIHVGHDSN